MRERGEGIGEKRGEGKKDYLLHVQSEEIPAKA